MARLIEAFVLGQLQLSGTAPAAGPEDSTGDKARAPAAAPAAAAAGSAGRHVKTLVKSVFPPSVLAPSPPRVRAQAQAQAQALDHVQERQLHQGLRDALDHVELMCVPGSAEWTVQAIHHRPHVISFVMTDLHGRRWYAAALLDGALSVLGGGGGAEQQHEHEHLLLDKHNQVGLVCVVTRLPVLNALEILLWHVRKTAMLPRKSFLQTAEYVLMRAHHELIVPPLSCAHRINVSLEYDTEHDGDGEHHHRRLWSTQTHAGLPFRDGRVALLFDRLGVGNLVRVLSCLLVEESVLLLSNDYGELAHVVEALLALLDPLEWVLTYVPVLPDALAEKITSVGIVFIGLSKAAAQEHLHDVGPTVLRVDLETDQVWDAVSEPLLFPRAAAVVKTLNMLERAWRADHYTGGDEDPIDIHLLPSTQRFIASVRRTIGEDVVGYLLKDVVRFGMNEDEAVDAAGYATLFPADEQAFVQRFAQTMIVREYIDCQLARRADTTLRRTTSDESRLEKPLTIVYPPRDGASSLLRLLSVDASHSHHNAPTDEIPASEPGTLRVDVLAKLGSLERNPLKNLLDMLEPLGRIHEDHNELRWLLAVAYEHGGLFSCAAPVYASLLERTPDDASVEPRLLRCVSRLTLDELASVKASVQSKTARDHIQARIDTLEAQAKEDAEWVHEDDVFEESKREDPVVTYAVAPFNQPASSGGMSRILSRLISPPSTPVVHRLQRHRASLLSTIDFFRRGPTTPTTPAQGASAAASANGSSTSL